MTVFKDKVFEGIDCLFYNAGNKQDIPDCIRKMKKAKRWSYIEKTIANSRGYNKQFIEILCTKILIFRVKVIL